MSDEDRKEHDQLIEWLDPEIFLPERDITAEVLDKVRPPAVCRAPMNRVLAACLLRVAGGSAARRPFLPARLRSPAVPCAPRPLPRALLLTRSLPPPYPLPRARATCRPQVLHDNKRGYIPEKEGHAPFILNKRIGEMHYPNIYYLEYVPVPIVQEAIE